MVFVVSTHPFSQIWGDGLVGQFVGPAGRAGGQIGRGMHPPSPHPVRLPTPPLLSAARIGSVPPLSPLRHSPPYRSSPIISSRHLRSSHPLQPRISPSPPVRPDYLFSCCASLLRAPLHSIISFNNPPPILPRPIPLFYFLDSAGPLISSPAPTSPTRAPSRAIISFLPARSPSPRCRPLSPKGIGL